MKTLPANEKMKKFIDHYFEVQKAITMDFANRFHELMEEMKMELRYLNDEKEAKENGNADADKR